VQLAHQAALLNSNIRADAVEATEYPNLVSKYSIRGVPKTVINEEVDFVGSLPESDFVERLLTAAQPAA
jgi:hypothetical protein